jgi:hypothetical protein
LISLFATSSKISVVKKITTASTTISMQPKATTTYPSVENKKLVIEKIENNLRATWTGSSSDTPFYFCLGNKNEDECVKNFVVYSASNIGTFDFYPSRNDLVIAVVGPKIVVVELDKRLPQNIVELYQSTSQEILDFRVVDNETIVIKEGKKLTKLSLIYAKQ